MDLERVWRRFHAIQDAVDAEDAPRGLRDDGRDEIGGLDELGLADETGLYG